MNFDYLTESNMLSQKKGMTINSLEKIRFKIPYFMQIK